MSLPIVYLRNEQNRAYLKQLIDRAPLSEEEPLSVVIREPGRTLEQNALMWPLLTCLAKQTDWHGIRLCKEEWKDLLSAGLVKEARAVPNLDGSGFVMVGQRTSQMSKKMFSELIELIFAFGAERGVDFSAGIRQLSRRGAARKLIEAVPSIEGQFRRVA